MRAITRWIGMGSAVAMAVAPALSLADAPNARHETPQQQQQIRQDQQPGSEARRVNEHFTRTLADNCSYEGTVEGTLRQLPNQPVLQGARYDANLTLRGSARCPDGRQATVLQDSINGTNLPGSKIEQWAAVTGRVKFDHQNGRVCSITPGFSLRGDTFAVNPTFHESCGTARGGGPVNNNVRNPRM